jgi:hypothetical protein
VRRTTRPRGRRTGPRGPGGTPWKQKRERTTSLSSQREIRGSTTVGRND